MKPKQTKSRLETFGLTVLDMKLNSGLKSCTKEKKTILKKIFSNTFHGQDFVFLQQLSEPKNPNGAKKSFYLKYSFNFRFHYGLTH